MALTVEKGGGFIQIIPDGATDYDVQTDYPVGVFLQAIEFVPSADGDVLKVREGSATGPIICRIKGTDEQKKKYFPNLLSKPFIKAKDLALSDAASALIILQVG